MYLRQGTEAIRHQKINARQSVTAAGEDYKSSSSSRSSRDSRGSSCSISLGQNLQATFTYLQGKQGKAAATAMIYKNTRNLTWTVRDFNAKIAPKDATACEWVEPSLAPWIMAATTTGRRRRGHIHNHVAWTRSPIVRKTQEGTT